jgi:hypothetical protein
MSTLTLEQAIGVLDTFMKNDLARHFDTVLVCWESMKNPASATHSGDPISDGELLTAFGAATRLEQAAAIFSTEANEMLVAFETVRQARQEEEAEGLKKWGQPEGWCRKRVKKEE